MTTPPLFPGIRCPLVCLPSYRTCICVLKMPPQPCPSYRQHPPPLRLNFSCVLFLVGSFFSFPVSSSDIRLTRFLSLLIAFALPVSSSISCYRAIRLVSLLPCTLAFPLTSSLLFPLLIYSLSAKVQSPVGSHSQCTCWRHVRIIYNKDVSVYN